MYMTIRYCTYKPISSNEHVSDYRSVNSHEHPRV